MTAEKKKVAILGGGPAAMACAFELTSTEALCEQFEVTVHQPGHRLGGKCASGRDQSEGGCDRILEHGLHIWFGFYDNAFALMRACYDELGEIHDKREQKHGKAAEHKSIASFDDAFHPCGAIVVCEYWNDEWVTRELPLPANPLEPGRDLLPDETFHWRALEHAVGWLLRRFDALGLMHKVKLLDRVVMFAAKELLEQALDLAQKAGDTGVDIAGGLLDKVNDVAWHFLEHDIDDKDTRFWLQNLDIATAIVRGIGADDLLTDHPRDIDQLEFSDWLREHGIHELTLKHSPVILGVYDSSFAYRDGDITKPDMAAGTALRDTLRTLFAHKGAFFYKMQAGMGDIVFAPLYEVLKERGVDFEFFSYVTEITPDAEGVGSVDIVTQVEGKKATYEPLVGVKGLLCWPLDPLWDQLKCDEKLDPDDLPDFEHESNPLGRPLDECKRTLTRENGDFDIVVLAFPPDVQKKVCKPLMQALPAYKLMLEETETVTTQAFQLWFGGTLDGDLGWEYAEDSICGSFVEPLDTWCTMSQLIAQEDDPEVESIVYCCGVMPGTKVDKNVKQANAKAEANTEAWVADDAKDLWPNVKDVKLLHSYARANVQATERYVLSVAGSMGHRLWPHDTGMDNLVFAGDWTRSGLDAGCVEGSVTSGLLAANALRRDPRKISGVSEWPNSGAGPQP